MTRTSLAWARPVLLMVVLLLWGRVHADPGNPFPQTSYPELYRHRGKDLFRGIKVRLDEVQQLTRYVGFQRGVDPAPGRRISMVKTMLKDFMLDEHIVAWSSGHRSGKKRVAISCSKDLRVAALYATWQRHPSQPTTPLSLPVVMRIHTDQKRDPIFQTRWHDALLMAPDPKNVDFYLLVPHKNEVRKPQLVRIKDPGGLARFAQKWQRAVEELQIPTEKWGEVRNAVNAQIRNDLNALLGSKIVEVDTEDMTKRMWRR